MRLQEPRLQTQKPGTRQGRFFVAVVRRMNGRMEKRLPIAVIVRLAKPEDQMPGAGELTYTNNVSGHGACVISRHRRRLGEMLEVTSLEEELSLRGNVVHCYKRTDNDYEVGLAFNGKQVNWSRYRKYACT